jgi:hypothetical protein
VSDSVHRDEGMTEGPAPGWTTPDVAVRSDVNPGSDLSRAGPVSHWYRHMHDRRGDPAHGSVSSTDEDRPRFVLFEADRGRRRMPAQIRRTEETSCRSLAEFSFEKRAS